MSYNPPPCPHSCPHVLYCPPSCPDHSPLFPLPPHTLDLHRCQTLSHNFNITNIYILTQNIKLFLQKNIKIGIFLICSKFRNWNQKQSMFATQNTQGLQNLSVKDFLCPRQKSAISMVMAGGRGV